MSFQISFDYRFDDAGFFDDPARRAALDAAAALWEGVIGDEFADVPAGTGFRVRDPEDLSAFRSVVLAEPIDHVRIFVGAAPMEGALARAASTGYSAAGDVYRARISEDFRGTGPVTDFEPWAGTMAFDSDADWSFALDRPVAGRSDFLTTAAHEIGHILGIGRSGAYEARIVEGTFAGPNAMSVNGGAPVPLADGGFHVADGFAGGGVLLDPTSMRGERKGPSAVDLAILADIGYEVAGFARQGVQPPIATDGPETIFGTVLDDRIAGGGGADEIQGNAGADTLLGGEGDDTLFGQAGGDRLQGGPGDDGLYGQAGADLLTGGPGDDTLFGGPGADVVTVAPGEGHDRLADFDLAQDVIRIVGSGAASVTELLGRIEKPFTNVSRLPLGPDGRLDVFHPAQTGSPLGLQHFELVAPSGGAAPAGAIRLAGTAAQGEVLTVDASGLGGPDGPGGLAYVWLRDGAPIPGARGPVYSLGPADVGAEIAVAVSWTDGAGTAASVQSAATAPVSAAAGRLISGTPAADDLAGTAGDDTILGGASDDTLAGGAGDDRIEAGPGDDVAVYSGPRSAHTVTLSDSGLRVEDRRADGDGADHLWGVETLAFGDGDWPLARHAEGATLAEAALGALVEMYIAYFDRAPDAEGLLFWAAAHANGVSAERMATLFLEQEETRSAYPDSASSAEFVQSVYQNVFGRSADAAGFAFWVEMLDSGAVGRDTFVLEVLRGVAEESPGSGTGAAGTDLRDADAAFLAAKTEIGLSFAVERGMNDIDEAHTAMALFDGSAESAAAAQAAIERFHADALDPDDGAFLLPLVGLIEPDPFA